MAKSDHFLSGDYAPVADRISLFYERFPEGRILTDLISRDGGRVTFKATVFRSGELASATGWASEREDDGDVNSVACVENTETSAVGRALANLGFTASRHRPSAEEMAKVARERARNARRLSKNAPWASRSGDRAAAGDPPVQPRADALNDVLDLLRRAEALGLASARAARMRVRVADPAMSLRAIERLERALRSWIASGDPLALPPSSPPPRD